MNWKVVPTLAAVCICLSMVDASHALAGRPQDNGNEVGQVSSYRVEEQGIVLQIPGDDWKRTQGTQGGSRWVVLDSESRAGTRVSLQIWGLAPETGSPAQLCDAELKFWRGRGTVEEQARLERTVTGTSGLGVRFRSETEQDGDRLVDATYVVHNNMVYRIALAVAVDDEVRLTDLVTQTLAGVEWVQIVFTQPAPAVFENPNPIAGNILTVVHDTGPDAPYRYLESLPGASAANNGLPVVLVVGDRLTSTARTFLKKYRPSEIRLIGAAHPELPQAEVVPGNMPLGADRIAIVSARTLADAIPAAALALRLKAPLLIDDATLNARLDSLQADHYIVVGAVEMPPGLDVEYCADSRDVADRTDGGSYIALCNVAEGSGDRAAVFAAALAGVHDGVVLPISEPVRIHRSALYETSDRPDGFVDESTQRWVTGTIVADGREVTVAAAATGRIRISGAESDRYSRPRIDLNGDGRFDRETEQVHVGETIQMLERPAAFTVRYQTAFGQPGQGEALLVQPDPAGIRRSIRSFVDHLGRAEHLAIVGAPDRIPFAILESEAYYKTLDIKQELASDAPYADLDDDPSLELAVGRVLVPDLERGSAILATSLAYPRFEGEWVARAAILAPGFAGAESRTSLLWVWPESESLARSIDGGLRAIGVECDTFVRDTVERADVLTAMQHAGWIGHMNHSNETTWGIKPGAHITSADLPELYGSPIVVDTGCSSAGIDRDIPLGNTMPGRFFDLGAVAYVGNTRPASLGTEAAVQQMYNRLIADGATIGQAYRDGRNLLAHLLEHGHMDPEFGTWIFDPAVYERTWLQFYNLNLFGDPALTARRPEVPNQPLLDVRLDETAQPDRHRLTITRHAPERVDPLLILPNAGPGTPREAMLPTAPGLSYGIVPHFYLDRNGLGPIRSPMAVAPGAWVDVELPAHFDGDVNMTVVDGPEWANRGFSIETDPNGPTRLRAYVPLVHTDLETGSGDVLDRVVFDVTTTNSPDPTVSAESATRRHHIQSSPLRATAPARTPYAFVTVTDAAREILTAIEARRYDPWDYGLVGLDFTVANPGSDVLENAECRLILTQGNTVQCSVSELPARLESHRVDVEQAFGCIADFVVNDPLGFLISGEYAVTLEVRSKRQAVDRQSSVLRLVALGDNEADEIVRVVVSKDARIEQVRRRRFGVEEVTHFEWHATPEGDIVTRLLTDDIRYGQPHVINIEYDTNPQNGYRLPSVITIGVPGLLARPFVFRPHYEDPAAQRL